MRSPKLHIIVAVLLTSVPISVWGQTYRHYTITEMEVRGYSVYPGVYRAPYPMYYGWWNEGGKRTILDRAELKVVYKAELVIDTLSGTKGKDYAACLVSQRYYQTFGYSMYRRGHTVDADISDQYPYLGSCHELINWNITRDNAKHTITDRHQLPMAGSTIEMEERSTCLNWEMTEETTEIIGYICQKAETDYCGRHWVVWYSREIPVDGGFWKFSGLPGMVLKASDSDHYFDFTAIGIEKTQEPIFDFPKKRKRLSREQFRETEMKVFASPLSYMRGGMRDQGFMAGDDMLVGSSAFEQTKKNLFTPENYIHIWLPLEKE